LKQKISTQHQKLGKNQEVIKVARPQLKLSLEHQIYRTWVSSRRITEILIVQDGRGRQQARFTAITFLKICIVQRNRIISQNCMKWMMQLKDGLGWINSSTSWRIEEPQSPAVRRSPKTPLICFDCISASKKEGVSWRYA
ncbi:hypothetical protein QAD02_020865, partial [Eretmocerus hayati]